MQIFCSITMENKDPRAQLEGRIIILSKNVYELAQTIHNHIPRIRE